MSLINSLSDRWRSHVAAREMQKRIESERTEQERYKRELDEWQNESELLDQELKFAMLPYGLKSSSDKVPILLHKNESVFLVCNSHLVETTRLPGHWTSGYSGVSLRLTKGVTYHTGGSRGQYIAGQEQSTIIAAGIATMTNERIVFQSEKETREFAFSKLLGYQHDKNSPVTFFHMSNRKKVSGLGCLPENIRFWRFGLSLALAHFRGETSALIEHIKEEITAHEIAKPHAPVPKTNNNILNISCSNCGKTFHVVSDLVGKRAKCPACKHVFIIPTATASIAPIAQTVSRIPWPWFAIGGGLAFLLILILLLKGPHHSNKGVDNDNEQTQPITDIVVQKNDFHAPASSQLTPRSEPKALFAIPSSRLRDIEHCWKNASDQLWGKGIQEIPATVIDKGILKYVPYYSYKCGDYEINVYGDPSNPACIEIGIRNDLLKSNEAVNNCIQFISSIITTSADQNILFSLNLAKDLKIQNGMTFEITPPTDEDAYGGWWVSVYDVALLDKSRASPQELKAITAPKQIPPTIESSGTPAPQGPVIKSRPGTDVYVRGYTRKDGTYVAPHTRSSPRR